MTQQRNATDLAEFPDNPHFPASRPDDVKALQATELSANQMLAPQTLGQALEWARILCDSSIVPTAYRGKPADVLTCILFGKNLGLDVVQALQNVFIVNGKATVYGDAILGIVLAKSKPGELETFEETWEPEVDGGRATCKIKRRGFPERVVSFSMDEARRIKTTENSWEGVPQGGRPKKVEIMLADKETYRNYPRRMCKFKARNEGLRDVFPDYLLGIIPREDAEDYVVDAIGYTVDKGNGERERVEGLEDLIGELEPDAAAQVDAGFERLALSRAQRLVKLREFRGNAGELLAWLRDEFALQKTRGAQHYRPRTERPEASAAAREATAKRLGDGLDAALQARGAAPSTAEGQVEETPARPAQVEAPKETPNAEAKPAASANAKRVLF